MPRKQVTTITKTETEQPPDEQSYVTAEPAEFAQIEPEVDALQQFLDGLGSNHRLAIYRIERTGEKAFLCKCELQYFSEEWLQATYGEGRYIIQAKDEKGVIRGTRTITMGPSNEPKAPTGFQPNPLPLPVPDTGGNMQLQLLMQEMAANREIMLEMIRANNGGGKTGLGDLVEVIQAMKALQPPPAANGNSMESMLSLLKTGIEIGQTGTVDTSSKGGVMGMIKDALPIVGDVIKGFLPQRAPEPGQNPPATVAPAQLAGLEGIDPRTADMIRHGISYLKGKVLQGKSPDTWIDFILDNMDDPQWQPFLRFAGMPYEEFAKIDAELLQVPYRPWFEHLLKSVQEALAQPQGEIDGSVQDEPPAGKSGD